MDRQSKEKIANDLIRGVALVNSKSRYGRDTAQYIIGELKKILYSIALEHIKHGIKSTELLDTLEKYEDM